ncbi:MAG: TonB-dependent receptor [Bacteroidota bacterium]
MKTRSKKLASKLILSLFIALICVSFSTTFSQVTISGKVENSNRTEKISVATVFIEGTKLGALSDENGFYVIKNVPKGEYQVICSANGYENFSKIILVEDKNLILNFNLKEINKGPIIRVEPSVQEIDEVFVSATRASKNTPMTYTNIDKNQISKQNFGQDLPYLLESTASTVVTSDAGAGVGYTGVRIRGVDPTRTNVTVNGIPLNDSESHGVYWVNMPDFASSVDNMQVQRGVGTSTNGAAAFGASINVQTDKVNRIAYANLDNSIGSFNTFKNTVKAGTGLMNSKFAFDMRLSRISSDGYIDRASSNLKSYFVSGTYLGKKSMLKANVFSGKEITYQAWYGVPEAKLKGNNDSLTNHFYNNYYPGGMYQNAADSANLFSSNNRTYNVYNYGNQVDNYGQTHYQLLYDYAFNSRVKLNLAGHYTHGEGFYEEYKMNDDLSKYNLSPVVSASGTDTITSSDLIRRRWLDNDFYGGIFSLDFTSKSGLNLIFGGGANQYKGNHFGEVIWARFASNSEINQRYYDNQSTKNDVNVYLKVNKQIKKVNLYADLQVRNIDYSYFGFIDSTFTEAQQKVKYTFFNPKAGLMYDVNEFNQVYASFAVGNREPTRSDFTDTYSRIRPKHETLNNLEVGYRFAKPTFYFTTNYYLMAYKNQLILTGEINDVGAYARTNVDQSYRTGVELETGVFLMDKKFQIKGNVTFSQNKVKEFTEFIDNYDNYDVDGNMIQDKIVHKNTDIAFSPNLITSLTLSYSPIKDLNFSILSKYVSKQFLDNTSTDSRSLDAYYITNLNANYTTSKLFGKEITFGLLVNNVFNHLFENNGYTWGYILGNKRIVENFYYPQAGINLLGRIAIKF